VSGKRWSLRLACTLLAVGVLGCQEPEQIRQYKAPREIRTRMLGAILPHGDSTWFVKVTGPEDVIEKQEAAVRAFVQSFHFHDQKEQPVTWKVPAGWHEEKEQPQQGEFKRFATFRLGEKGKGGLELTVIKLGREGQAASILANVNRWRGQLGLIGLRPSELEDEVEELKAVNATATLVDITGTGRAVAGAQMPPPEHPPVGKPPARGGPLPLAYTTPKGWTETRLRALSVATFRTGEEGKSAEVTITPLAGPAGGLVGNVKRWRDQIGMPPASDEQIQKGLGKLDVGGTPATYVELVGPEVNGRQLAILGAIVPRGGETWFFKMTGPADVVAGQKANFEAFVRSVRFEEQKGGQR
jgi:hypothetical protein